MALRAFRCDICRGTQIDGDVGQHSCPECDLLMREIPLDEAAGPARPTGERWELKPGHRSEWDSPGGSDFQVTQYDE